MSAHIAGRILRGYAAFGIFGMGALVSALSVGGMALLFSALLYLIPLHGSRPSPDETFEESQKRIRRYLRELRRDQADDN
jgi:hypothetical protein